MFTFEAQNFINAISNLNAIKSGVYVYQGLWNAETNTFVNVQDGTTGSLVASTGTQGHYYFVTTAGTTDINGNNDWEPGDWIWFDSGIWKLVRNDSFTTDSIELGSESTNHSPLTLGTANGLSLADQELSLSLADSGTTGALSSTDWNTFNNKQSALGFTPENIANKNQVNGYAGLDSSGKLYNSQLPAIAITDTFVVASEAAMLALSVETGDVAVRTDLNKSFILAGTDPTLLSEWQELLTPTDTVLSVNGQSGIVSLNTSHISESSNLYYTDTRVRANRLDQMAVPTSDLDLNSVSLFNINEIGEETARANKAWLKDLNIEYEVSGFELNKKFDLFTVNIGPFSEFLYASVGRILSTDSLFTDYHGVKFHSSADFIFSPYDTANLVLSDTSLFPLEDEGLDLGKATKEFNNIYGVNGSFSTDINLAGTSLITRLAAKGNISGQTWTGEHNFPYFVGVNSSEVAPTDGATFRGRRQLGAGGQVIAGTVLSGLYAAGWTNSGAYSNNAAAFRLIANQSFTSANQGTYMDWQLNQDNQNFRTTFMILRNSAAGGLTLGQTAGVGTGTLFAKSVSLPGVIFTDSVTSAAVGGSQDKKIKVTLSGVDYYIPCYTA